MKVIASHNGRQAVEGAWEKLGEGASILDACVAGVTRVEDDPRELTVGYGGLPNEDGEVELDAAVMDGRMHRGGAVAGLKEIRHAARVAQLVMERTNRVLLVGDGALKFAESNGFRRENLLTEQAHRMWLYWKRTRSAHDDWQPPDQEDEDLDVRKWFERYFYGTGSPEGAPLRPHGTVHCAGVDARGDMACATTTSGAAFKIAGRVGDSPILGAGLYVDNEVGSCGSIGHGEANQQHVSSYAAVELMRQGCSPQEAGLEVLRRVADRLLPEDQREDGRPNFQLQLFLLTPSGEHAGVSMFGGKRMAIADQGGTRFEPCTPLFET